MTRSTKSEVMSGLAEVLVIAELTAQEAASIGEAIEYLQTEFFNEDASREIDRLTAVNEQQTEIIALQESRISELEDANGDV